MSGVTAITLGTQSNEAGIVIPITLTATTKPNFIQASFSDQVHNTASAIGYQITNIAAAAGDNTWTAEASLNEYDMGQLFPNNNFTNKVKCTISKGTVNASVNNLEWHSAVNLRSASAVAGGEQITLTVNLDPNYVNSNLTAQITYSDSTNASSSTASGLSLTPVQVNGLDSDTLFTCTLTGLLFGKTYEVQLFVENDYGSSNSITLNSIMTSYDPGSVTINSFDSLDASGAVTNFTVQEFDYSTYKSLNLLLDYKAPGVGGASYGTQQSVNIDICGVTNPDAPTANRAYEINRYVMNSTIKNAITAGTQFVVTAQLQAVIDVSGLSERTYVGPVATETYWMDQNMGDPTITLSEIDWVSGAQTVKAVIDGCFNEMTFKFDLSGAESTTTTYDICGTTQQMTATKVYNYSELNAVGKAVEVSASRPERNGGASVSRSGPAQLAFLLKAVKRAPQPAVTIDFLPNGANTDTKFTFTNIPDISYSDVYAVVYDDDDLYDAYGNRDNSGNAIITISEEFSPGERYVAKGYTRFDLHDASFDNRYITLNENSDYLLSAAVESQTVSKGQPTLSLAVRPVDASSNELKVVRLSGDMKANDVAELICFARDVCGNLLQNTLTVNPDTVDSCGNNLSGSSLSDLARVYAHDFVFDAEIAIGSDMFLVGIVDTPNAYDAITVKETADAVATAFKTAVDEYNAAESANNTAQDLSNNPLNDPTYAGYVTAIANYDISLSSLTTDISAAILVRDGSANGSEWFAQQKADAYTRETKKYSNAFDNYNAINQAITVFDTSYAGFTTAADRLEYQKSGSVTFSTKVYVSPTNDASAVSVTVTGTDDLHLEARLDTLSHTYGSTMGLQFGVVSTALLAKDDADQANATIDALITAKEDEIDDLPSRPTYVQDRDNRATALVTSAANTAATLVTKTTALGNARSAFFPL